MKSSNNFKKILAPIIATVVLALLTNACEDCCGLKVHHIGIQY